MAIWGGIGVGIVAFVVIGVAAIVASCKRSRNLATRARVNVYASPVNQHQLVAGEFRLCLCCNMIKT